MASGRCHWVRDEDDTEVLIPFCWAAVLDPVACTCGVEGSPLEQAEARRDIAEGEVLRLREKLISGADRHHQAMALTNGRLRAEIQRLRREIAALNGEG